MIGGIGSLRGTLIGGLALGVAQTVGGLISAQFSILAGHVVFLAVLGWRMSQGAAADRGGWRAAWAALITRRKITRGKA